MTVSTVMNVYNNAQFVKAALDSIVDFSDQIIIVEGCWSPSLQPRSDDGTLEIVREFVRNTPHAELIEYTCNPALAEYDYALGNNYAAHEPSSFGNQLNARRIGFEAATSDWIMWHDSDEIYHKHELEELGTEELGTFLDVLELTQGSDQPMHIKLPSFVFYFNENFGVKEDFLRISRLLPGCELGYTDRIKYPDGYEQPLVTKFEDCLMYHYAYIGEDRVCKIKRTQWDQKTYDGWLEKVRPYITGEKQPEEEENYHLFADLLGYGGKYEKFEGTHPESALRIFQP
jgi:glycosyltransferase involved in cell wall biosynthesis